MNKQISRNAKIVIILGILCFPFVILITQMNASTIIKNNRKEPSSKETIIENIPTSQKVHRNELGTPLTNTEITNMNDTVVANWTQIEKKNEIDCKGEPDPQFKMYSEEDGNETWHVAYCIDSISGLPYTRFIKKDGLKIWEVSFYELYGIKQKDENHPEGIKNGVIRVKEWSKDGKYAYINPGYCCLDGPGMLFIDVFALYRLDLNNGEIIELLPNGASLAFSSDSKYLAYSNSPNRFYLRNLNTETDNIFNLGSVYDQIGLFSWSPDNSKLIFVGAMEDWFCSTPDMCFENGTPYRSNDGFTLFLFNMRTWHIEILIDNDLNLFRPNTGLGSPWIDNENISVTNYLGNTFVFNIEQKELIPLPTQTP